MGQLFESVTEIIRYTKEEIGNIKEFPFLAEEKAYQVLNKIKGFKWPRKERRRKLFDSNVEDVCVEDLCTKEEMQEDYENWPVAQQISKGKVRSNFKKTRNNIRKQCMPYEWNKVGLPTKYDEHGGFPEETNRENFY